MAKKLVRKPRVRKTETIRERTQRATAKAEARAAKPESRFKRLLKKTGRLFSPLKKPLHFITAPLRTRPIRFIGRWIGRILWPRYFRNSYRELRQVHWPTRRETWKMTFAVLVFALVFGLGAAGIDWVLDNAIQRIVFSR